MGIIYFIIVTPTGLLLKLFNKKFGAKNNNYSYWKEKVINQYEKSVLIMDFIKEFWKFKIEKIIGYFQ